MSAGPYIYSSAVATTSQDNFSSPVPALSPVRLPAPPHMPTDTQQPRRPPAAKFRGDFGENPAIFFVVFSAISGHGTPISMPRWLVHRVSYDTHLDLPPAYNFWLPACTRGTFTAPSPHASLIPRLPTPLPLAISLATSAMPGLHITRNECRTAPGPFSRVFDLSPECSPSAHQDLGESLMEIALWRQLDAALLREWDDKVEVNTLQIATKDRGCGIYG